MVLVAILFISVRSFGSAVALPVFDDTQPPTTDAKTVARAAAVTAEMAAGVRVVDEAGGGEMRIIGTDCVDECPQVAGIGGRVVPVGEIGSGIGEGECGREVHADQSLIRKIVEQPVKHILP